MRIRSIKTGETMETRESYALRLIEQGKAVPAKETTPREHKRDAKKADERAKEATQEQAGEA